MRANYVVGTDNERGSKTGLEAEAAGHRDRENHLDPHLGVEAGAAVGSLTALPRRLERRHGRFSVGSIAVLAHCIFAIRGNRRPRNHERSFGAPAPA